MTKVQLIEELRKFNEIWQDYDWTVRQTQALAREIEDLKEKPHIKKENPISDFFGVFFGIMLILFIPAIIVFGKLVGSESPILRSLLITLAIFSSISGIISLILVLSSNHDEKKYIKKCNKAWEHNQTLIPDMCNRLRFLQNNVQQRYPIVCQQAAICGLHEKYWSDADEIIDLLATGRCDTMKEAINTMLDSRRYFAECQATYRHNKQMEKLAQVQNEHLQNLENQVADISDSSERAAKNAQDAAFWGAATAYEVDKMRRENR